MVFAKKSFGQHFLADERIAERIGNSLRNVENVDALLEVGPGRGMLTKYLLRLPGYHLKCVEADRDMISYLAEHYPQLNGDVVAEDFLDTDLQAIFPGQYLLIGNFPYNISSQIIIRTLDHRDRIPELVGMFQREMALRAVASCGDPDYGGLSVQVRAFYEPQYLFTVKPGSFNPPPKVQSAVIRLLRKPEPPACNAERFRQLVRTAFGQRRKMLRNTLSPLFPRDFLMADPAFTRRAEELEVEEFVALTNLWGEMSKG